MSELRDSSPFCHHSFSRLTIIVSFVLHRYLGTAHNFQESPNVVDDFYIPCLII